MLTSYSSLAIDEIICSRRSNAAIAYVYFDYKNREIQTGDYIVRTILKQLLVQLKTIPRDVEATYDDCCSRLKQPEKTFFVQQLLSMVARFGSVYVLLDALDECTDATLENIIHLICQLKDSEFKVFCTFRPNIITLSDKLNVLVHTIHAHDEDVRNYLSIRLKKEWLHDESFLPEIIDQLGKTAKGKFVSLVFIC